MTVDQPVAIRCTVNGKEHELEVGPGETLLRTLRDRLWLTGTKEGCVAWFLNTTVTRPMPSGS